MGTNDSFTVECNGKAARKSYNLKLTKKEIADFAGHFPEKVKITLPVVGEKEFEISSYVKALLITFLIRR